jgi:tRNA(Ile)-lysidine synthase
MRLAVALSGGADSVALLRALAARREELGLVLHAAHLHHGLRGAEADGDLEFCRALAARLATPFHEARADTAAEAKADAKSGKPAETIEEAARRLRYAWFRELISKGLLDAIVTAHTRDDQAETVLAKFLRGAWTEGLAGISPRLEIADADGCIVRPLLHTTRAEILAYLDALDQDWREDSSNRHLTFTRNRIRHELLPLLEGWNPQLREHLAQMAELAHDEEAWWQAELDRLAPQLILPGRPARGGGRTVGEGSSGAGLAMEVSRLAALAPALQRRLVRHVAEQFGVALDFAATEAARSLALGGRAGQRLALPQGLCAERSARELRFSMAPEPSAKANGLAARALERSGPIPGEIDAPEFGIHLHIDLASSEAAEKLKLPREPMPHTATLRNWRPGDRVRLRYSSGPRKVKEVLERLHVTGSDRALWPVLEAGGRIVWMQGVELEPEPGLAITVAGAKSDRSWRSAPK